MKIIVETILSFNTMGSIELPISSWKEIKGCFVKWDTFNYTLDGVKWNKVPLNSKVDSDIIDWKRPVRTVILTDKLDVLATII